MFSTLQGSWDAITPQAIQNCFRKAGFVTQVEDHGPDGEPEGDPDGDLDALDADESAGSIHSDEDNADILDPSTALDCPPGSFSEVTERWEEIQQLFESTVTFEEFVSADDFTPVCQVQSIQDIIATLRKDTEVRGPLKNLCMHWVK